MGGLGSPGPERLFIAMTAAEIQARLTKIDAGIDFVVDGNAASLAIAGRSLTALSLSELEALRDKYQRRLNNINGVRPLVVRFGRPSA